MVWVLYIQGIKDQPVHVNTLRNVMLPYSEGDGDALNMGILAWFTQEKIDNIMVKAVPGFKSEWKLVEEH